MPFFVYLFLVAFGIILVIVLIVRATRNGKSVAAKSGSNEIEEKS
jgi:hypothetical protein